MSRLWRIWLAYCDSQTYPPSERAFAMDMGMSPTAFGNWEAGISRLPDKDNLAMFAYLTGTPYSEVLDAALHDAGYLPSRNPNPEAVAQVAARRSTGRKPRGPRIQQPD